MSPLSLQSRRRLADAAQTFFLVAPLTILIWIYAEREQIARVNDLPIPIQVRATTPNRVALLRAERTITVEIEGPKVRIDALRTELLNLPAAGLLLELPPTQRPGLTPFRTVDLLNANPRFQSYGVKVAAASPAELPVLIEEVESRTVTVIPDLPMARFEGAPTFDPPTVRLSGPGAMLRRLGPTVRADFSSSPTLLTPGAHDPADVGLTLPLIPGNDPNNSRILVTPDHVRATFRIRATDITFTVPAVPLYVEAPHALLDTYRIECPTSVEGLSLQASPDMAAAIKSDAPRRIRAVLEVSLADLPANRRLTRRIRLDLPEGVTLPADAAPREVDFTLFPRAN